MEKLILLGYGKMAKALALGLCRNSSDFEILVYGRDSIKIEKFCAEIKKSAKSAKIAPLIESSTSRTIESSRAIESSVKTANKKSAKSSVDSIKNSANAKSSADFGAKMQINIESANILLCVKPAALDFFSFKGRAKAVFSILNGIKIQNLKEQINADFFIRAMPNIAASLGKSATAFCIESSNKSSTKAAQDSMQIAKNLANKIFGSVGVCVQIEEAQMSAATALGGCSPAFLALIAESLIDSAVANGLKRDQAQILANALFSGFSELLQIKSANEIKEEVMSPGGSTAAGIESLEKSALRGAIFSAFGASKSRA